MAQRVRTDWTLFWTIVLMAGFGLVMVYSASSVMAQHKYKDSTHFITHQIFWAVISFFVLMFAKRRDYRFLDNPRYVFAGIAAVVIMLVAVYFADPHQHRWFKFPLGSIQPSEFAKPVLVLFLAYFLSRRNADTLNQPRSLLQAGLVVGIVALAVVVADLGTALVLLATAGVLFFMAGLKWKYCAVAAVVVVLGAGVAVVAKPYRLVRVMSRVDPDYVFLDTVDPGGMVKRYMSKSETTRDANYQGLQSRIAVGSGGVTGLGLMASRQKWLFLPEAHTDFIYAIIGEELGIFGCTAILIGFLVIMWRGFRLFWLAPDSFGKYLALGIAASITLQALINMSVVLDMGVTKGIPLPLISAGGSSLFSTLLCLGLLLSVSEQSS